MQNYQITITAAGEVRDADGNLVSSTPVESVIEVSEDELRQLLGSE